MMKSKLLSVLILAQATGAIFSSMGKLNANAPYKNPCKNTFQGIYLGSNLGYSSGHTKEKGSNLRGNPAFKAKSNLSLKGI